MEAVENDWVYQVCVLNTNRQHFDYEAEILEAAVGTRVWVPFRKQTKLGLIIGKEKRSSTRSLKKIAEVIDKEPLLDLEMLNLCQWVSSYYQSSLSEVLTLALPKKYRAVEEKPLTRCDYYQLAVPALEAIACLPKKNSKREALINFLNKHAAPLSQKQLQEAGFSLSQLKGLVALQILKVHSQLKILERLPSDQLEQPLSLNKEQALAVSTINQHSQAYHCFLLEGVTGSGKTEVYLQVIAETLARDLQVLVLVPEIGLTPQLLARFTARFKVPIAVLHSHLNESERQQAWLMAKSNVVKLIIGTRTAIFTPMPSLGLIVIDEEHDASLKQMDGVRYSARDTALMRAYLTKIPIILGSATPSLESLYNSKQGKYQHLRLTEKALTSPPLHYQLIDLRSQPLEEGLTNTTLQIIEQHLKRDNQVLVFINRRGFAPVLLCHQCGWIAHCNACDSAMTLHRKKGRLICHHCGLSLLIPLSCKSCASSELIALGSGTQRIEEYLATQFPKVKLLRIDRDEVLKKNELNKRLQQIHQGEAQLIVGTQMLAKGHHFPRLTLVVILDSDTGFYNQDFRAIERLGQLLIQVSGRAGRAAIPGEVLIQTHIPHHPLLNLLIQKGYDSFASALLALRKEAELPPYHFLAAIRAQHKVQAKTLLFLHQIKKQLLLEHSVSVLGPAPAPLARKADEHRMQLLLKCASRSLLQRALTLLREWLILNKLTQQVRWSIDVDPLDLS